MNAMNDSFPNGSGRLLRFLGRVAVTICLVGGASLALAAPVQRTFASAEEAAAALVTAVKSGDRTAVLDILGHDAKTWIFSPDAVADRDLASRFVAAYERQHAIAPDRENRATLTVGPDEWPFAFPLVKSGAKWRFDTAAGKREMLARRIGENELAAINVLLAIVDAQREYAAEDRNADGLREYARRFASSDGKKDGLYWPTAANEPQSPLGPLVSRAAREGYRKGDSPEKPVPFHGYYFRMLKGQGPLAKGGAVDYEVRGRMIGGFAVVAWPAKWGNTGVMTFIVNHDGVVHEKDLGAATAETASAMTRFNPDAQWAVVRND